MNSLRQRLQISLTLTLLLFLSLLAIGTGFLGERLMHQLISSRLADDSETLLAKLQWIDNRPQLQDLHTLSASYQRAYSGHYFVVQTDGLQQRSQSHWDQVFDLQAMPATGAWRLYETAGPLQQNLLVRVASYEKQGHRLAIWMAEDMSPHYAPLHTYYQSFALVTVAILLLLWLLQRRNLQRELATLDQVADAVAQMKHGELMRLSEEVPDEVVGLVREVNRLASQLEKRIERSRHAIGNVAHALKTPLALLQQQAELPLWREHPQQRVLYTQQLRQIQLRLDEELRRARIMGASHPVESFNPAVHLPALIETVKRVHFQRDIEIHSEVIDCVFNGISRDDMLELLGNLLDNACKWAKAQVWFEVRSDSERITMSIEDDGLGIEQPENLLQTRGQRLDEQHSGHGLGLAICQEIVAAYDGSINIDQSPLRGGLRVMVKIPVV